MRLAQGQSGQLAVPGDVYSANVSLPKTGIGQCKEARHIWSIIMRLLLTALLSFWSITATAETVMPRDGWVVMESDKAFGVLLDDLKVAVSANKMGVVTQAGPTDAAANSGITIPNNRVIGVFNNVFAVRILALSPSAMIKAPIRFYLTEDAAGVATLC
ncbi:MAG: hypothetical protein ACI9ND_001513 [Yoonia sp.]